MAVVKGSKQEKMIVVPYRPKQAVLARLSVLVCIGIIGAGFYFYGHSKGVSENTDARFERDRLQSEVTNLSEEMGVLRQEVVNNVQEGAVNQQALQEVQDTILSLREKNAQLEEDVLFYKQVMSPENTETGLVIGLLDLVATGEINRIRYRIEFKQMAENDGLVTGYANVNILGVQDGQEISIPLRSLSATEEQLEIKLQFRYFQNIEGELTLPVNFEPEKIQILAVAEGSNAKTIQKSFGWIVEG
jgi:hypothetical protein